jgi:hypothetical protein
MAASSCNAAPAGWLVPEHASLFFFGTASALLYMIRVSIRHHCRTSLHQHASDNCRRTWIDGQ